MSVLESDGVGLISCVIIIEDDFRTLGIIAYQIVAIVNVVLDVAGSVVASIFKSVTRQVLYSQSLASGLVNVGYGCRLGVWSVSYDFLDVGVIVSDVLVRNALLVGRVALQGWRCNFLKVLRSAPNSLDHLPSYLVNRCGCFVVQAVVYASRS